MTGCWQRTWFWPFSTVGEYIGGDNRPIRVCTQDRELLDVVRVRDVLYYHPAGLFFCVVQGLVLA